MTPTQAPAPAPAPAPTAQHHANLASFLSILERILTVIVPVGAAVAAPFLKSSGAQATESQVVGAVTAVLPVIEAVTPQETPPAGQ